ncbi:MAG TPA: hypothetical protein PLY73_06400 [Candidatus Ozemobacteraceae bacterium]|nr:hypothetical protein [Candidatus Ozemobacteraceae bacterium]
MFISDGPNHPPFVLSPSKHERPLALRQAQGERLVFIPQESTGTQHTLFQP